MLSYFKNADQITDSYRHSSNESISGYISTKTGTGSEYIVVISQHAVAISS